MHSTNHAHGWRRKLRQSLSVCARLLAVVLVMATMVTLFARSHWLPDILANLRIQQCLALLTGLVVFLVGRRWTWVAAISLCLAIHLPWFFPVYVFPAETDANADVLTVTLANVHTRNERHDEILVDVLRRDPDVLVILELSTSLAASLDSRISSTHPHSVVRPHDDGNFGIGLYSRFPIEEYDVFILNSGIESIDATITADGKSYRLLATHPFPPMGTRGHRLRNDHLDQLAARIHRSLSDASAPIILVGDFNLTPWSPHFADFQRESGLRRAANGFSFIPTWYGLPAFPFGLVLDHAMVSEGMVCTGYAVGDEIGSDHRSVTVRLAPPVSRRVNAE